MSAGTIKRSQLAEIAQIEDGGSQRQRYRAGDQDHRRLRAFDGLAGCGGLIRWQNRPRSRRRCTTKLGDNLKLYGVDDAIQALKDLSTVKFDEIASKSR